MKEVTLYTDGAARGNPGPGGWAALLRRGGREEELSGGYRRTTNNRMELLAAIEGLAALERPCRVDLFTDSRYLVDAMEKGWARRWQARGWMRTPREEARNPDLWQRLLALCARHRVTFRWIRGHAGHRENERCDRLCRQAARRPELPPDEGYESPPPPPGSLFG